MTAAADPARVAVFKAAVLADGASEGGLLMEEGGGDRPAVGDRAGPAGGAGGEVVEGDGAEAGGVRVEAAGAGDGEGVRDGGVAG